MIQELDEINQHYKSKYPTGVIDEIKSNKTLLGCFIKDFDSKIIVPHSSCVNTEELRVLIIGIKNFPLLGKFYTLPFLITFRNLKEQYADLKLLMNYPNEQSKKFYKFILETLELLNFLKKLKSKILLKIKFLLKNLKTWKLILIKLNIII